MERINSYTEFIGKAPKKGKSFLLLYKSETEQSNCAFQNLIQAEKSETSLPVFTADVNQVRDIHSRFGISTVPSLLIFTEGEYENTIKGCQESSFYNALFENAVYQAKAVAEGKALKRVTVYSTPSCSWCNTLKTWLRKNHIPFTDLDVSRDEKAAEEMVRRSGQQGVPQTDINGQIVVGFNQSRLKELLEIQ
ncbi:MAG: NrdH-redoxin [Bacteroidales bacterium]|nr:NrdH-redoxin [Bacteroidales bacterium]